MLLANAILQNRYRVIRELGHGGMGTVYEALDQRLNCIVALKETFAPRDGEARKAFEREAELLANLHHQALPKVMDSFSENEGDFLVMEFIAGHDLKELLASRGSPFPQSQVLSWADELLKLLEYLHAHQPPILHRDIKPANLKITDRGEIFLLDFGLAKGSTGQMPTLMDYRSVRGYTRVYAALEQIHEHGTDPRSDLYSLGATLYHLLAGVPPTDAPKRYSAIEDEQPDPLQLIERVNPLASSSVTAVIHQAMAITRKQRPASAAEMRKILRNAAEEDERKGVEEEARLRAEEETRLRAVGEARLRAEENARLRAEKEVRLRAEEEAFRLEAETLKSVAQELSRRRAEAERIHAEGEARARAEDEMRQRVDEEMRRRDRIEEERGRQVEVVMPQMGESIAEGTITKRLKQVGENVEQDEPLFEIATDKVDAEIPAPAAGVRSEIRFKEGIVAAEIRVKAEEQARRLREAEVRLREEKARAKQRIEPK